MLDETEQLRPHACTDGLDFQWDDSVHLNYRKKHCWDLLVDETRQWALRGVSGIRLDSAQSWPVILRPDNNELFKEDNDGEFHYSLQEIMDGDVVLASNNNEAKSYGYWGTTAAVTYPNPLFVKLTREIWRHFPNFIFLAEVFWGREQNAILSGLIPYTHSLSRSLASIFNLGIHKDGSISYLQEKRNVSVFYDWYQVERAQYAQNATLVYPSSSHHLPYPTRLKTHFLLLICCFLLTLKMT
jgi:hypothetical protein